MSSVASTDSLSTPSSTSAAATIGAESRSPRLESESSVRGVSSRSSAVPLQSRSPSPKIFSRCAVSALALFGVADQRARSPLRAACAARRKSRRAGRSRSPRRAWPLRSAGWSRRPSRRRPRRWGPRAKLPSRSARPARYTRHRPQTCRRISSLVMVFSFLEGSGAKRFEMPGARGDLAFRMAAPQKTIHHRSGFAMGAKVACGGAVKTLKHA